MARRLLLIALAATAVALSSCGGDSDQSVDPLAAVIDASEKTIAAGPAQVRGSVLGPVGDYQISGQLDPTGGYRLCAGIDDAAEGYLRGHTLWLEERSGTFSTWTAPLPTQTPPPAPPRVCPRDGWLDDHPPTLPLYRERGIAIPAGGLTGAEDFLHAALLALTQMRRSAVTASAHTCGAETCYGVQFDFRRFGRKPSGGDEDLWTLRPLLRALGKYPFGVRVGARGLIDRVQLAAPNLVRADPTPSAVAVEIRLSDFGHAPAVPRVQATAIE